MLIQVPNINDATETKTSLQVGSYSLLHCFKFLLCFLHLILQSEKKKKKNINERTGEKKKRKNEEKKKKEEKIFESD